MYIYILFPPRTGTPEVEIPSIGLWITWREGTLDTGQQKSDGDVKTRFGDSRQQEAEEFQQVLVSLDSWRLEKEQVKGVVTHGCSVKKELGRNLG